LVPKCYVRQPLNYWLYGEVDCIAGRTNISSHHLNFKKWCKNLFSVPFWIYCVWKECILVALIATHHTSTLISLYYMTASCILVWDYLSASVCSNISVAAEVKHFNCQISEQWINFCFTVLRCDIPVVYQLQCRNEWETTV
jgi:hypothetical protein